MEKETNEKIIGILDKINNENMFIKYDYENNKYIINPEIEKDICGRILNEEEKIKAIYNYYGNWYYEHNDKICAIKYYYKANNIEKVIRIIVNIDNKLIESVDFSFLKGILEDIDEKLLLEYPMEYLKVFYLYMKNANEKESIKVINEIEEIIVKSSKLENKIRVMGEIYIFQALINYNNKIIRNNKIKQADEILDGDTSSIINEDFILTLGLNNSIYYVHNVKGKLNEEVEEEIKYLCILSKLCNDAGYGIEHAIKSQYYLETGEYKEAEAFANRALNKAKIKKAANVIIIAYYILIRIHKINNEVDKLEEKMNMFTLEIDGYSEKLIITQVNEVNYYVYGTINDKNQERINYSELKNNWTNYILKSMECVRKKKFIDLEVYSEYIIKESENHSSIVGSIYGYIFKSILEKYFYNDDYKCEQALFKAINIAEKDNIITPFLENFTGIREMLLQNKAKNLFVKKILSLSIEKEKSETNNFVELTKREIEIMKLLSVGFKQSEISSNLHIALTTVKKHVSSVYDKIGIRNKTIVINILKEKNII